MSKEGLNQKSCSSSSVSIKGDKPSVNNSQLTAKPVSKPIKRSADKVLIESHLDPTRYGDWEQAGRCIDF